MPDVTLIWLPSRAPELNPVENARQYLGTSRLSNPSSQPTTPSSTRRAWRKLIAQPDTTASIGMRPSAHTRRTA